MLVLNNVLKRPCDCCDKSHKGCGVNLDYEYSTTDTWFLNWSNDHTMSYSKRIYELAEELDCPYKLLMDYYTMKEIIDWVDTNERLGWCLPPARRENFIDKCKFVDSKDIFDENADVYVLFEQYVKEVKSEKNEIQRVKMLWRAVQMVRNFGTSDGYLKIIVNDKHFMIHYQENKESINILLIRKTINIDQIIMVNIQNIVDVVSHKIFSPNVAINHG